jgi:hypothetical protein
MKIARALTVTAVLAFFYAQLYLGLTNGITPPGLVSIVLAALTAASIRPSLLARFLGAVVARRLLLGLIGAFCLGEAALGLTGQLGLADLGVLVLIGGALIADEAAVRQSARPLLARAA